MPPAIERRYFDFSREGARERAPKVGEGNVLTGYALVFNQPSRVMYDKERKKTFTEYIDKDAVDVGFLNRQNIVLNFNHDRSLILARAVYGFGSMSYDVDEYGVLFRAEMPDTTTGRDVLELVRRGDLVGCSFAFTYDRSCYKDEVRNGENVRTFHSFGSIVDFSVVTDPAYEQTMVMASRDFEPEMEEEETHADPSALLASDELELYRINNYSL